MFDRKVIPVLFLLMILLPSILYNIPELAQKSNVLQVNHPASTVWSDDFNDLNYDNWQILGFNATTVEECHGNFSADDGTLRSVGDEIDVASHESAVAFGTWMFDVYVVNASRLIPSCMFISSNWSSMTYCVEGYGIRFEYREGTTVSPGIELGYYTPDLAGAYWTELDAIILDHEINGWQHVEIIRQPTGQFTVLINQTYTLSGTDDRYTESEEFRFIAVNGLALDNVSVGDVENIAYFSTTTTIMDTDGIENIALASIGLSVIAIIIYRYRKGK